MTYKGIFSPRVAFTAPPTVFTSCSDHGSCYPGGIHAAEIAPNQSATTTNLRYLHAFAHKH